MLIWPARLGSEHGLHWTRRISFLLCRVSFFSFSLSFLFSVRFSAFSSTSTFYPPPDRQYKEKPNCCNYNKAEVEQLGILSTTFIIPTEFDLVPVFIYTFIVHAQRWMVPRKFSKRISSTGTRWCVWVFALNHNMIECDCQVTFALGIFAPFPNHLDILFLLCICNVDKDRTVRPTWVRSLTLPIPTETVDMNLFAPILRNLTNCERE